VDQVNDDYCDCPDGSDEPGTSACTYLSTLSPEQPVPGTIDGTSNVTVALPGFYCKNKGHQPSYLPFTLVNDGVCDYELCCDGSDEWAGVGDIKCPDQCASMGKEWRKKEAEREKAAFAAGRRRTELVKKAYDLKLAAQQNIERLKREIEGLEVKAAEAKKNFEEVERKERGKVFKGASSKASKVTVLAKLAKDRVEELRETLSTALERKRAARNKIAELETLLSQFKVDYNPNFNDEGVKRAVKAWDDYAAKKDADGDTDPAAEDRDFEEIAKPDSESEGINWAEWEVEEEESDVEARKSYPSYIISDIS
jgi:protein kinase C substrate 80K-H